MDKLIMKKVALYVFSSFISLPVMAHPHSWIDMKTKIVGNEEGIHQLSMSWEMDPMTSSYALDGVDRSAKDFPQQLKALAEEAVINMYDMHYLTYLSDGKTSYAFAKTTQGHYTLDGMKLILSFDIKFKHPVPIVGHMLLLQSYDPTYYVDMVWKDVTDVSFSPELAQKCHVKLIHPHPTAQQISYAASIPADVNPSENLGKLFAQTSQIVCL
ncbi:DUF1007 family protein [Vibrio rumoiensis]|uniref:DUF1007 family protein n=1 Tax=Vibrio rumoiensis TaxID=76258 RepID=A0ABW7ISF3_9VIBR|nr:DUF1007 family protein [Vibrio rumoiensis]